MSMLRLEDKGSEARAPKHAVIGMHEGLRALGETSAAEVLARAATQTAAAGSAMAAEAAPLVVAMQLIRSAVGTGPERSKVTRDTVAAELNLVRSAVGLLMLREYQFMLRALEASCGDDLPAAERKHADRAASFALHAMSSDKDAVKKLAKKYESDPLWPEGEYWKIWFALATREAKRSDAPMATFALRVAQTLAVMRERTRLARERGACTEAAMSEMVRAQMGLRGEEAEWVLRAIARADECLADAAEREARRQSAGSSGAHTDSGGAAESKSAPESAALAAAAAEVVPAGSEAVVSEAIALTAAGAARRAAEAAGQMLDVAVAAAPATSVVASDAAAIPSAVSEIAAAKVRAERRAVSREIEEDERTEAHAIDALVRDLQTGSRKLVPADTDVGGGAAHASVGSGTRPAATEDVLASSGASLTPEELLHLLEEGDHDDAHAHVRAHEDWRSEALMPAPRGGRAVDAPSEDWGSPVPTQGAESPVSVSMYRIPGDGVAVAREGAVPGMRGAHFAEFAAVRPLPGGEERAYSYGFTYSSDADADDGSSHHPHAAQVTTPIGQFDAGGTDEDLVQRVM